MSAPSREPLHVRVAGALERAFNPIMVKELRGSLRGARFFIAHLVILGLFAAGLLLLLGLQAASRSHRTGADGWNVDPAVVGREVFMIVQLVQLGVVFLVVPGLAATSISSERENLTHDLLLTTTMTARHIVWGKFTAAMTQTVTIFASLVPLVALCFLFGGVTVYQIVANYTLLLALSALMAAMSVSMSAAARTSQRAVSTVYALALAGGGLLAAVIGGLEHSPILDAAASAYGFLPSGEGISRRGGRLDLARRVLYVHGVPAFAWTALVSLFFVTAVNRLKPLCANRSTPLRIYFAATLFGAGALLALAVYREIPVDQHKGDRSAAVMSVAVAALSAALMASLFAGEEPDLLQRTAPARGIAATFLRPGSESGARYAMLLMGVFCAAATVTFLPFSRGFDQGAWAGFPPWVPLAVAFGCVLLWTSFCSTATRWLAAALPSRPVLARTLVVLGCLFLALFPLVHWMIADAVDRDLSDVMRRKGPVTLAASPVMAVLSTLDLSPRRRDFPLYAGPLPVPAAFAAVTVAGSALFFWLGQRARLKLKRLSEREAPGSTPSPRNSC